MISPILPTQPVNLAELWERLGNIPLERILLQPAPGTAVEADVLSALEHPRKRICELVDGVLVEKAMGYSESILATYLIELLNAFVRSRNLGLITAPDGTIRLWTGCVRIPDVAFFSWDRLPGRRRPIEPIPEIAPDLAVEIVSRSNTRRELQRKREDLFAAGVRLIWEIDPASRLVQVYSESGAPASELTEDDQLDGGQILSGFRLPLRDLFSELDRQG